MNYGKIARIALSAVIAMVALTACHSRRNQAGVGRAEYDEASLAGRFAAVADDAGKWDVVSVPVNLSVSRPVSISFSGRAYFSRDKSVYISLRKLGFEVARLYVTSDSLYAVDKFNKRYVAESLAGVTKSGVGIRDLQNLLIGLPFLPGRATNARDFVYSLPESGESWLAIPVEQPRGFQLGFMFSRCDDALTACAIGNQDVTFTAEYSAPVSTDAGKVASVDHLTFASPKLNVEADFKWSWNQARWNSPDDVKGWEKPSSSYKRIDAASLLKALAPK